MASDDSLAQSQTATDYDGHFDIDASSIRYALHVADTFHVFDYLYFFQSCFEISY